MRPQLDDRPRRDRLDQPEGERDVAEPRRQSIQVGVQQGDRPGESAEAVGFVRGKRLLIHDGLLCNRRRAAD